MKGNLMAKCLVCGDDARNILGIRLRYGKQKDAHWAPDLDAYLCERHAKSGVVLNIEVVPTSDGRVRAHTYAGAEHRNVVLIIGSGGKHEVPGQERLIA